MPERDTVAIVDDDDGVRSSLSFLLGALGHKVETFARAADFLASERQHVLCLILDHHMPGMTGLQLAETLRERGVRIPTLLVTGSPSYPIVKRALELGIDRVLEKPPQEDELLAFIKAARR